MEKLQKLLKFTDLTNRLRSIIRSIYVTGSNRQENDSEHSYQLAMLAWYIIDSEKTTGLDRNLVIKYALIHDFVEVFAGDTDIYTKDQAHKNGKASRERDAAEKLNKELSEFEEFNILIENYEKKSDKESKFIYALDKVIPVLNIYLDNGRTWKTRSITLDMIIEAKQEKVAISPEIKPYFKELVKILKEKEHSLFHE